MRIKENTDNKGNIHLVNEVKGVSGYDTVISSHDLLVIYGKNKEIEKFLSA